MDDVSARRLREDIESTPESEVLWNLRRLLWEAFAEEDGDAALRILKATRDDYDAWRLKEALRLHSTQKRCSKKQGHSQSQAESSTQLVELTPTTGAGPGLLQQHLNPSAPFSFTEQDYGVGHDQEDSNSSRNAGTSFRKTRGAKYAFSWATARGRRAEPSVELDVSSERGAAHPNATTPLHEAARLGHDKLVQFLLSNPLVDINARNGAGRTPLIMAAGGVTEQEASRAWSSTATPLGIRVPQPVPTTQAQQQQSTSSPTSKAARAVRRFIRAGLLSKSRSADARSESKQQQQYAIRLSDSNHKRLLINRTNTTLTILAYSHPDDGSDHAGQGPSINSVDALGRTALHYAAEMGRTEVCQAIANSFGAMLTVVDDMGRTPIDLAGAQAQCKELAAYLEARAILYVDPYGMDEELLAAVEKQRNYSSRKSDQGRADTSKSYLAPPFAWFETWDMAQVQTEREARIDRCLASIQRVSRLKMQDQVKAQKNAQMKSLETEIPWFVDALQVEQRTSGSADGDHGNDMVVVDSNDCQPHTEPLIEEPINTGMQMQSETESEMETPAVSDDEKNEECIEKLPLVSTVDDEPRLGVASVSGHDADSDMRPASIGKQGSETKPTPEKDASLTVNAANDNSNDCDDADSNGAVRLADNDMGDQEAPALVRTDYDVFEHVHKAHIELLLKHHQWDGEMVIKRFAESPYAAFMEAEVPIPVSVGVRSELATHGSTDMELMCLICCDAFDSQSTNFRHLTGCKHSFCVGCLGDYLTMHANARTSGMTIACPHHDCNVPLTPLEIAELSPTTDVFERLLVCSSDSFVGAAKDLRYCPHPGCSGIVKINAPVFVKSNGIDSSVLDIVGATCTATSVGMGPSCDYTYEGMADTNYCNAKSMIPPRKAHRFCFGCGETGIHWPCPCDRLEEWKMEIEKRVEEAKEEGGAGIDGHDDIAQKLWLKTNTRPCPKCKAPIQKNEGCNHMTCSNPHCKHEFCWICRNDWKLHNTETGGFFRCNRWVEQKEHEGHSDVPTDQTAALSALEDATTDPNVMAVTYGTAIHASRVLHKKSREVARFIHHYQRWSAHADSAELERSMSESVSTRLAPVVLEAIKFNGKPFFNFGGTGLSFVHGAFVELYECRSLLQHSYAFSFFRYGAGSKVYKQTRQRLAEKVAFEQLQSELELLTEQMSDVVARAHLRATQSQILFLTASASERRCEFSNLLFSILNKERKETMVNEIKLESQNGNRLQIALETLPMAGTSYRGSLSDGVRLVLAAEPTNLFSSDANDLEAAIRASLGDLRVPVDNEQEESNDSDAGARDWACTACTYVNTESRRCAMCNTTRTSYL